MIRSSLLMLALAGTVRAEDVHRPPQGLRPDPAGVLVMAHGGDAAWDKAVHGAVKGLEGALPVELAFGMADAESLQAAVKRLEAKGVRRIAVVRLFMSGDSFLGRTRQILGLEPGAPPKPAEVSGHEGHASHDHAGHQDPDKMPLWRIETQSRIALSAEGLLDGDVPGRILAERAKALSKAPKTESVLIIAHGPGDDAENARWLEEMDRFAAEVRKAKRFKAVQVETLREDWPEKRKDAERRIREFVADAAKAGGRAIVLPLRIYGFGPYAKVLKDLPYVADKKGLIPHPLVGEWLRKQAAATFTKAGWTDAAAPLN